MDRPELTRGLSSVSNEWDIKAFLTALQGVRSELSIRPDRLRDMSRASSK